ncbi:cupin domain-containing protein [Modestobacter sp. I12A-02662]|uniref:cupin domain-containing protein n=1 Tax=Modestobacter sp. I12A-02662 TaxID=1730496 RepID=UPI0034DEABA7
MTPTARRPVHVAAASVRTAIRTPWGDRISEVVPASLTAGAFASFHVFASASAARPAYVHHAADEAIVVVSGTVTVEVAGQGPPADLTAGAAVYVPRGALRSFRTGASGAWLLVTQTPGQELGDVPEHLANASADPAAESYRHLTRALAECGVELVPVRRDLSRGSAPG